MSWVPISTNSNSAGTGTYLGTGSGNVTADETAQQQSQNAANKEASEATIQEAALNGNADIRNSSYHSSNEIDEESKHDSITHPSTAATNNSNSHNGSIQASQPNNGGVSVSMEDLGLSNISENTIRAMLDPTKTDVNPLTGFDWTEARLDRLVDILKPEHLAVLIKKRMDTALEENAKTLSWHHLTYTTKSGVKLLDDVSGYVLPGMLVGLLGAPDSGITPLLQILAGESAHHGKLTGEVLYDGRKPDTSYNRQVGFAVKQDTHLSHLTVYESLFFSARLRLPGAIPDKIVRYRVKMAMKLLGISHTANTYVGDAILRGISGGEKRRLGFGLEMVAGHSIILADLPTNGLDSATAYGLIRTMAFACRGGFSLMASLVQPSLELFLLLDRVILLSKGRTIYFGPPGAAEAFFRGHGFLRPPNKSVPQFLEELSAKPEQFWQINDPSAGLGESFYQPPTLQNDSTELDNTNNNDKTPRRIAWNYLTQRFIDDPMSKHILDELTHIREQKENHQPHNNNMFGYNQHSTPQYPDMPSFDVSEKQKNITDAHNDNGEFSSVITALDKEMMHKNQSRQHISGAAPLSPVKSNSTAHLQNKHSSGLLKGWYAKFNSGPGSQFRWNLWRQIILTVRNVGLWRDIWLISTAMGLIIGSLFFKLGTNEVGVRNRVGEFFYILSYIGFNAVQLVPVLHEQREVYYNQIERGYYQTFGYYFSLLLVQIPIVVVDTLLLLVPIWGLSGLTGYPFISADFWYAYLIVLMNSLVSRVWMFVLYAASPNEVYADVLNQVTNILFTKLAGYFIAADLIVGGWKWMYDISYFTYSLLGLAVSDVCPTVNTLPGSLLPGGICYPTSTGSCRFQNGVQGISLLYNMNCSYNKWWYFADSIWFFLSFNMAGYVAFWIIDWSQHDVPEFPNFGELETDEDTTGDDAVDIRTERVSTTHPAASQHPRRVLSAQEQEDAN